MKVLVTGFDPFGGEAVNPAYEAVKMLPDEIEGAEIIKLEIPTVFSKSEIAVEEGIKKYQPDIVINVGQAGNRSCVTIERVAVNLAEARIPDNAGEQPMGVPLKEEGAPAYYATIPVKAMVKNVRDHKIPCHVSYTAGTYVCNSVMYNVLHMTATKYQGIRAGFIHVPFAAEQVVNKPNGTPFMSLEQIAESLKYAIAAAVTTKEDILDPSGEIS
ncbi:MAG: pyroglutamyl-peptidase I [Lachnospiraceae bacterium]|nr:pyroglutamyl-peptidase I [Lachnospiraceae bacterium]